MERNKETGLTSIQEDMLAVLYLIDKSEWFQINRFPGFYVVSVDHWSEQRVRLKDAIFAAIRASEDGCDARVIQEKT